MPRRLTFDSELQKLDGIAQAGYYLAIHIRFSSPLINFQTYDRAWMRHYTENGYVLRDPVVAWAFAGQGATRWSDIPIPDPFGILVDAASFGLRYGVTISAGPLTSRTVANFAHSEREYTDDEIVALERIVKEIHAIAEPTTRLTRAQAEALTLLGKGHRHSAAANMLGISESALKARLSSARERLMARTTAEAIQRARDGRLI